MSFWGITVEKAGFWSSGEETGKSSPRLVTHYEIECFERPCGESFFDGVGYSLTRGSILFASPGRVRFSRMPYGANFVYFTVSEEETELSELLSRVPAVSPPSGESEEMIKKITELYRRGDNMSRLRMGANLTELFFRLAETSERFEAGFMRHREEVLRAALYMKEHLGENLDVNVLAREAGYSAPHFASFFRASVGVSPMKYFFLLRIREAKRLLTETDMTLSEIADALGFCHESHFIAAFRREVGMTPAVYRRLMPEEYSII